MQNNMDTEIQLYYPTKLFAVNQVFGADPGYYAKFKDPFGNPQKGHPGLDLSATHGQPVYAAHDGQAIWIKDSYKGEGIYLFANGYLTNYWHMIGDTDPLYPPPIPFDQKYHAVSAGDLIGYADNTGAPNESSGDHCHFGLAMTDTNNRILNQENGFSGFVDPLSHFTGKYAQDIPKSLTYIKFLVSQALLLLGLRSRPLVS